MGWTRWFKINGEEREFMYLFEADTKEELLPFIDFVKGQGDLYRIIKEKGRYFLYDARV